MEQKSPAEDAKNNPKQEQKNPCGYDLCVGSCPEPNPQTYMKEHDKIYSRNTGRMVEIGVPPVGGGLVSKNPFASLAQEHFMHAHPDVLGKKGLAEWDSSTKGKALPKHVKK